MLSTQPATSAILYVPYLSIGSEDDNGGIISAFETV